MNKLTFFFENFAQGYENAVTILELQKRMGCSNRMARMAIQELRLAGVPIISVSSRRGYFLATQDERDKSLARQFIAETKHRIGELHKLIKPVRKYLANKNQLQLF